MERITLRQFSLPDRFFGLIDTPSGQTDLTRFLVLKAQNAGCLLNRETSTWLGMLHIAASTTAEHPPVHGEYQSLLQKFPAVFSGRIGKLKDYQLELNIDPTVRPVVQNSHSTPLRYRARVETKLKQLEDQDIIEQATGPTPWVSPLVIVDKLNGDIRLCVNMCKPNEALNRTHHLTTFNISPPDNIQNTCWPWPLQTVIWSIRWL